MTLKGAGDKSREDMIADIVAAPNWAYARCSTSRSTTATATIAAMPTRTRSDVTR